MPMQFLIADSFTDSLTRLSGDEQKAVKTTAFDLQLNPASPGMSFHKLDRARDKRFWSVRVNSDIRLIVHKSADSLLLCYVDHHNAAYEWAQRRKLETHPRTGAAQLVEIRETVQEREHLVDAWQLVSWEAYRDVVRLGRKSRLTEPQRRILWNIFARVRAELDKQNRCTISTLFTRLAETIAQSRRPPYDHVIVDEAQDISVAQLRFCAAMAQDRPNALFFAGDIGQRIFQQPFSWKSLGVDLRGRSKTLRVNYRTSHQIRQQADQLLNSSVSDADGNREERGDTVSVFNGPAPVIQILKDEKEEIKTVTDWIAGQKTAGIAPQEIGIIVRTADQLPRAEAVAAALKLPYKVLDDRVESSPGHLSLATMHLAKGLEFRAVAVMACDEEVIPLQNRIESIGDEGDLQEAYDTERQLLYVACTRARDALLVTCVKPGSEFLGDMLSSGERGA